MKRILFFMLIFLGSITLFSQGKMFLHTSNASNISGSVTYLDHPLLNNNPDAKLIASHCYNGGINNKTTGVYYDNIGKKWSIFNEDASTMQPGKTFFVYVASDDYALLADNEAGSSYLYIDHPLLNNHPEKVTVMSNLYNIWNNVNYGFWYDEDANKWVIYNESEFGVPQYSKYFVATEGESGVIGLRKTAEGGTDYMCIDHPKLNGNPNAKLVFTHNWGKIGNTSNVVLDKVMTAYYSGASKWCLGTEDFSVLPAGTMFDILLWDDSLGISDVAQKSKTTVFPNPVTDEANFSSEDGILGIKLYDMTGKEIMNSDKSGTHIKMDLSMLSPGLYLAKVTTEKGTESVKVIKK